MLTVNNVVDVVVFKLSSEILVTLYQRMKLWPKVVFNGRTNNTMMNGHIPKAGI